MSWITPLRTAPWLAGERARAYGLMLWVGTLLFGLANVFIYVQSAWTDPRHVPVPNDFVAFWSGARLAWQGHAGLAYDLVAIRSQEAVGAQAASGGRLLPYMYPPTFLLITLPFALLGYVPSLLAFVAAGYAAFVALLRRIAPAGWPILAVAAFPGAVVNAVVGQNGFISAACFAGALLWLERRPALAGACLGMFAFKPHLALCVPVALLAARRWRALAACAATSLGLILASWAVLGSQAWVGFAHALPITGKVLQASNVYGTGCSVYSAILILGAGFGAGFGAAWAGQAASAALAAGCVGWVASRRPGPGPEMAVLACAALLCTPYVMDYDLVCLGVPLAWLAACGAQGGFAPWEKAGLIAAYLLPLVARTASIGGVPVSPLVVAGLLALLTARARRAGTPVFAGQAT